MNICVFLNIFLIHLFLMKIKVIFMFEEYVIHDEINSNDEYDIEPEVEPGLFEGDIAFPFPTTFFYKIGINPEVFPNRLWPNRTIPYKISSLYDPEDRAIILQAIHEINSLTCVRFIPWNEEDPDYILIWPVLFPRGCWSFVGKMGGEQLLSLQPPDDKGPHCLGGKGKPIHELLHALGLFHEQSRSDRDEFVTIHWDNIIPTRKRNFRKLFSNITKYSYEYDYNSIMHYGKFYFTKTRGRPTITSTKDGFNFGQRKGLSVLDCLKVNDLYGCLKDSRSSKKYSHRCRILGL